MDIQVQEIRPAPWNPPDRVQEKSVADMAKSIKAHGQKSAGLVRPVESDNGIKYELVFGHRRWAACTKLEIPFKADVEEMDEATARVLSLVENQQRHDLTDLQEAELVWEISGLYGEKAVKLLATNLSMKESRVRRYLALADLPPEALKFWREGWTAGHMEQLLRLGDTAAILSLVADVLKFRNRFTDTTVADLAKHIDRLAIPLHSGHFDKADCKTCPKSSTVQKKLFDLGAKDKCQDKPCFMEKERAWMVASWKESPENTFGTNTAEFTTWNSKPESNDFGWDVKPGDKCKECGLYATIFLDDLSRPYRDRACMGEDSCFLALKKEQRGTRGMTDKERAKVDPDAPRVAWHGEYYRQQFYKEWIPHYLTLCGCKDELYRARRLMLALQIKGCSAAVDWFWKFTENVPESEAKYGHYRHKFPLHHILEILKDCNNATVTGIEHHIISMMIAKGDGRYQPQPQVCHTFTDEERQAIAQFLHVDWSSFKVSEEYLRRKTKTELVAFVFDNGSHSLQFHPDISKAMRQHFKGTKNGKAINLKEAFAAKPKSWMVEFLMQSKFDLTGWLPKEIMAIPELTYEPYQEPEPYTRQRDQEEQDEENFTCPVCGCEETDGEECQECGLVFADDPGDEEDE
jgi:ParB/RepB/Spo0J family partition protein